MASTTTTLTQGSPSVVLDVTPGATGVLSFKGAPWAGALLRVDYAQTIAPTEFISYPRNPDVPWPYGQDGLNGGFGITFLGPKLRLILDLPSPTAAPSVTTELNA